MDVCVGSIGKTLSAMRLDFEHLPGPLRAKTMGMSLAVHLVFLRCSLGRFAPCSNAHEMWETPQLHLQNCAKII